MARIDSSAARGFTVEHRRRVVHVDSETCGSNACAADGTTAQFNVAMPRRKAGALHTKAHIYDGAARSA